MSDLTAETTYYYRIAATNSEDEVGYGGGKATTNVSCIDAASENCYDGCASCCTGLSDQEHDTCMATCMNECTSDFMPGCLSSDPATNITLDTTTPTVTITDSSVSATGDTITIPYTVNETITSATCEYGLDESYGNVGTISNGKCVISGLDYGTEYFYKITVTDVAYNEGYATGSYTSQSYCDATLPSVKSSCQSADYSSVCTQDMFSASCSTSCSSEGGLCYGAPGDAMGSCMAPCISECIGDEIDACRQNQIKSCITNTMSQKGCSGY